MGSAIKALDLNIVIEASEPAIWRTLRVPADVPLNQLHHAIQAVFGWKNIHLYAFVVSDGQRGRVSYSGDKESALELGTEFAGNHSLDQILSPGIKQLTYEYDFGDIWDHSVSVVGDALVQDRIITCIGGENRGPVEDSGGISGYQRLAGTLADSGHPEYEQAAEWFRLVTDEYQLDPTAFDVEQTNEALRQVHHRHAATPPTPEETAEVVRPVQWLLREAGDQGFELTASGYLKPAAVKKAMSSLKWEHRWFGTFSSEYNTIPILDLREWTQSLKLLRKQKGRLVRTPLARALYDDAPALWNHLATSIAQPEHQAVALVHAVVVPWIIEYAEPPRSVRNEVIAEALNQSGFGMPGGAPVEPDDAGTLFRDLWRSLQCLNMWEPEKKLNFRSPPSEAGMKFLLEVRRRQGQ